MKLTVTMIFVSLRRRWIDWMNINLGLYDYLSGTIPTSVPPWPGNVITRTGEGGVFGEVTQTVPLSLPAPIHAALYFPDFQTYYFEKSTEMLFAQIGYINLLILAQNGSCSFPSTLNSLYQLTTSTPILLFKLHFLQPSSEPFLNLST